MGFLDTEYCTDGKEAKIVIQQIADNIHQIKHSSSLNFTIASC